MQKHPKDKTYISIDLKSFYASVECVDRGLDALNTNLLVADATRTSKTICLAVSPSLKSFGMGGRARLFEAISAIKDINKARNIAKFKKLNLDDFTDEVNVGQNERFIGDESCSSIFYDELDSNKKLLVDFIIAPPRMARYMEYSKKIYGIYLKYIAPEDIHVYSVDEVFIDATSYLNTYKVDAHTLAMDMINDVLNQTGITATAGIGTNLYLTKIAMDIKAKKMKANKDGVRIAYLDEELYKKELWDHTPLTDFWRIGRGYVKKLNSVGLHTMGDIAKCSLGKSNEYYNEELLFKMFGMNAELLIDHAWGYEPVTLKEIKNYKPRSTSISSGQVLTRPYESDETRLVVSEMADFLSIDLVKKDVETDSIVLTIGYDIENLNTKEKLDNYKGEISIDYYGRIVPYHAHGTINLDGHTNSSLIIIKKTLELYDRIIDEKLLVRRINIEANHIKDVKTAKKKSFEQLDIFDSIKTKDFNNGATELEEKISKDRELQKAMINIRKKYGSNAILKASSLKEGATAIERNSQIGGHKA